MAKDLKSLKQSQNATRMNLAEWRASHVHEMDLPSGLHVRVRDMDMTDLLLTGRLPGSVLSIAEEAAAKTDSVDLTKIGMDLMKQNGPDFKALLDTIARVALVEPQIGDVADDAHITIDELTIADKSAIMEFINREVQQLKSFRDGESEPVETVFDGDGLRLQAERVLLAGVRDRGVGAG
jgi:hypothetical protein